MINKYPYTDFHELNLDWFLKQFKTLKADWEAMATDNAEFKQTMTQKFDTLDHTVQTFTAFVTDYFDNLDVQQEINNKLDEMVLDGTLATVLAPFVDTEVPAAVSAWLDQNVTPTGSVVTLDKTLRIEGSAADAAAVGDHIYNAEETSPNLFWCRSQTVDGITVTYYGNGIAVVNGTAAQRVRFPIMGVSDCDPLVGGTNLPAGTYRWTFERLGGTITGNLSMCIDAGGGNYSYYTSSNSNDNPFTVSAAKNLHLTFAAGYSATDAPYHFKVFADPLANQQVPFHHFSSVDNTGRPLTVYDEAEPGALNVSGWTGFTYGTYWQYRRMAHMLKVDPEAAVRISVTDEDAALITSFSIYEYQESGGNITFLQRISGQTFGSDGSYWYAPKNDVAYVKIVLVLTGSTQREFDPIRFSSSGKLQIVKNASIYNAAYNNLTFSYKVGEQNYTSGQMFLPPNYSVTGKPVPLIVHVHGTGAMDLWDAQIGMNAGDDSRYLLEYLANEGFAVFDCYPWTDKWYLATSKISPFNIPIHQRAYIDGIKWICDRYNVDIDNVCMSFKSLGGSLGNWFMVQTELPVRGIAMLAPSTGWASTMWAKYFLRQDGRQSIVNVLGLQNETNANQFITTYRGMESNTCISFVTAHLDAFAGLNPAAIGVQGATYRDQYDWMTTGETVEPAWMTALGLPMWPSSWNTGAHASGVPGIVNHPELSKFSPYPVKFWQAFDDENTSAHANYTVYTWLKNGGSKADWRTVPSGTGGHHAIDISPSAETASGTTRLGIAYSGIAKTYVEMADYFYDMM